MSKEIKVAADLGNSKLKMYIGEQLYIQPSVVKFQYKKPMVMEQNLPVAVEGLQDNLHLQIQSNTLQLPGIYSVGNAALQQDDCENMDIDAGTSKDQQDIPIILLTSYIAAAQVQNYFKENKSLPELLKVDVELLSALPASQYKQENINNLKKRLLEEQHMLTLFINEKLVSVHINFQSVKIASEGVPPLILLAKTKQSEIFADYKELYGKDFDQKSLAEIKTLHSDVGDGTHELIVSNGLKPIFTECSGSRRGVGHAVQKAIELLADEKEIELNRQEFMEVLRGNSKRKDTVKKYLERTKIAECNKIYAEITKKCTKNNPELVVVYGGGSIEFKEHLYQRLVNFCAEKDMELLWIPSEFAVNMNIEGMKLVM